MSRYRGPPRCLSRACAAFYTLRDPFEIFFFAGLLLAPNKTATFSSCDVGPRSYPPLRSPLFDRVRGVLHRAPNSISPLSALRLGVLKASGPLGLAGGVERPQVKSPRALFLPTLSHFFSLSKNFSLCYRWLISGVIRSFLTVSSGLVIALSRGVWP